MQNSLFTVWVSTDIRVVHHDGRYYSTHPGLIDATLDRCRLINSRVVLIAREAPIGSPSASQLTAMDSVQLITEGTGGPLNRLRRIIRQMVSAPVESTDVVVCRIPEVVGTLLWLRGIWARSATVANIVAEGKAASGFLGRNLGAFSIVFEIVPWLVARFSSATIYVTPSLLQRKYPPGNKLTASMSNVQLPFGWASENARSFANGDVHRLIAIGNLNGNSKGFDLIINAMQLLTKDIPNISLTIVGEGANQGELVNQARDAGLNERVHFTGFVNDRTRLAQLIDESDLLVIPSRSEGLPRVAVEGQSRGLPCIGSNVGGIPEAIPQLGVFRSESVLEIAQLITRLNKDGRFASLLAEHGHVLAKSIIASAAPENFTKVLHNARHLARLDRQLGASPNANTDLPE